MLFLQQLVYSKSFLSLVESDASDPHSAGAKYLKQWTMPWLVTREKSNAFAKAFDAVFRAAGKASVAQLISQVATPTGQILLANGEAYRYPCILSPSLYYIKLIRGHT